VKSTVSQGCSDKTTPMTKAKTKRQLTIESEETQTRLRELEDTLEAIRSGAVDAIVTSGPAGDRVYTLEGADHAYHTMVESMNEGAVTILTDGTILYGNRQFGQMTGASPSGIVGRPFHDFVQASHRPIWERVHPSGTFRRSEGGDRARHIRPPRLPYRFPLPRSTSAARRPCPRRDGLSDRGATRKSSRRRGSCVISSSRAWKGRRMRQWPDPSQAAASTDLRRNP
jgi:PAS domain-containing protein